MIPFHFESGDPVSKCNVITYRLKRNVPPHSVLNTIYDLLNQYNIAHRTCLWSLSKHVDTSGSGIRSNSVLKIMKDYPQLADCCQKVHRDYDEIHRLTNYQDPEFVPIFPSCEDEIRKIISNVPQTYHINCLEYILDGVDFANDPDNLSGIRENPTGFGPPVGSFISYYREAYGAEQHAYIILATQYTGHHQPALFRTFFFELAKRLPGTYEGTEIITE